MNRRPGRGKCADGWCCWTIKCSAFTFAVVLAVLEFLGFRKEYDWLLNLQFSTVPQATTVEALTSNPVLDPAIVPSAPEVQANSSGSYLSASSPTVNLTEQAHPAQDSRSSEVEAGRLRSGGPTVNLTEQAHPAQDSRSSGVEAGRLRSGPGQDSKLGVAAKGSASSCQMPLCLQGGSAAATLYVRPPVAHFASELSSLVEGLAISIRHKLNFGGVLLAEGGSSTQSGDSNELSRVRNITEGLFGAGSFKDLFTTGPRETRITFKSAHEVEAGRKGLEPASDILLDLGDSKCTKDCWKPLANLPVQLVGFLREQLLKRPAMFAGYSPAVAMDLKCGKDTQKIEGWPGRYYDMMDRIRNVWMDSEFLAWSRRDRTDPESHKPPGTKDLINFLLKGAKVHYLEDASSHLDAWSQMARADALMVTPGSCSYVPAALNQKCVIWMGSSPPVKGWLDGSKVLQTKPEKEAALRECLRRAHADPVKSTASKFCTLDVCTTFGPSAPRLFVQEHGDGAGHRMKNILEGMAVAHKNRMNFGGVVPVNNIVTEHGHNFRELVDALFGRGASLELFLPSTMNFSVKYESARLIHEQRPGMPEREDYTVFYPSANGWMDDKSAPQTAFFSPELVGKMARRMDLMPLHLFAPGRLSVAIHARRGDLKRTDARATSDQFYYDILEVVRAHHPDADVHLWSSIESYSAEAEQGKRHWKDSDFDGYRARNVQVHLDSLFLFEPWTHMARADVLISSSSSFSFVPSLMNQGCVIYPGNGGGPIFDWIDGNAELKNMKKDPAKVRVPACLKGIAERRRTASP